MIEQSHDYRLNPLLMKGCRNEISKFCSEVVAREPQDKELEGKVVKCLKVSIFLNSYFLTCIFMTMCSWYVCKSAPNFSWSVVFTVL